jgi:hypothetical protein
MRQARIALSDHPVTKAAIAAQVYYPGKLPRVWPHGHYRSGRATSPVRILTDVSLPIRVEPGPFLGFTAMLWPDEIHAQPLTESDDEGHWNIEAGTEEGCFYLALRALEGIHFPIWPEPSASREEIHWQVRLLPRGGLQLLWETMSAVLRVDDHLFTGEGKV